MDRVQKADWIRTALAIGAAIVIVVVLILASRNRGEQPAGGFDFTDQAIVIPSLTGIVTAVTAETLTIDVPQILGVAIPERSPFRKRTVILTSATKIVARTSKTSEAYQRERVAYAARRAAKIDSIPPHSYSENVLSRTELRVGDTIRVIDAQHDLKSLFEITPMSIYKL